jgi:hypothetical protein
MVRASPKERKMLVSGKPVIAQTWSPLTVGAGRDEPELLEPAAGGDGREEAGDGRGTLIFERCGRHGEEGVVGEQPDDGRDVTGLERVDEAFDQFALLA